MNFGGKLTAKWVYGMAAYNDKGNLVELTEEEKSKYKKNNNIKEIVGFILNNI